MSEHNLQNAMKRVNKKAGMSALYNLVRDLVNASDNRRIRRIFNAVLKNKERLFDQLAYHDQHGSTALHLAVRADKIELVGAMLDAMSSLPEPRRVLLLRIRDGEGRTALQCAISSTPRLVEPLLAAGADLNFCQEPGLVEVSSPIVPPEADMYLTHVRASVWTRLDCAGICKPCMLRSVWWMLWDHELKKPETCWSNCNKSERTFLEAMLKYLRELRGVARWRYDHELRQGIDELVAQLSESEPASEPANKRLRL